MLYNEEGNAYVEPPLIPQEQRLFYIVKDYRRMYVENSKLENQVRALHRTNHELKERNKRQAGTLTDALNVIDNCVKYMTQRNIQLPQCVKNFVKKHKSTNQPCRHEETCL